jgi:hypothetical protein
MKMVAVTLVEVINDGGDFLGDGGKKRGQQH